MGWRRASNTMVRSDQGRLWLCIPLSTISKLFEACGMARDWERANFRVAVTFLTAPSSPYVYLVVAPRYDLLLPKDAIAGHWRHAIEKPDGRIVFDLRNSLDLPVDGLHSLRQFEPGDRLRTDYASGSNCLRILMPRRPVQVWDWIGEEDLW